jgi:hypothetical protein
MVFQNGYGIRMDLSWFSIISCIVSVIGIFNGASWIVKPVAKETHGLVARLTFLPLFLFRMSSWLIIIIMLHSFSMFVLVGHVFFTLAVLFLAQRNLLVDPTNQTLLSMVFPVNKLPSSELKPEDAFRILFWLLVIGNVYFATVLGVIFVLYRFDFYNPWCSKSFSKLMIPEEVMTSFLCLTFTAFVSATLPFVVVYAIKQLRLVKIG